jgi:hypothetical protein
MLRARLIFLQAGDGVEVVAIRGSNAAARAHAIFDIQEAAPRAARPSLAV